MSPECLKDLNLLMNHLIKLGGQYKATMRDFMASTDKGIADFLRAEAMERYEMSSEIADYIQKFNGTGVAFSEEPAPVHGTANVALLQAIIKMEQDLAGSIDGMISRATERGSETTKQFLIYVKNDFMKEHNEVKGIIGEIAKIANDPGAMLYYNNFLEKEYEKGYE